jgi:hypothetical protein
VSCTHRKPADSIGFDCTRSDSQPPGEKLTAVTVAPDSYSGDMRRPPTRSDVEIAEALTDIGYPTTPRQVRTWRQRWWIDKAIPGGAGRPSTNTPETLGQALKVAEARGRGRRSRRDVALTLFLEGSDRPTINEIRTGTLSIINEMRSFLQRIGGQSTLDFNSAEQGAQRLAKVPVRDKIVRFASGNLARLFKTSDSPVQFELQSVWHTFISVLVDEPLSPVSGDDELSAAQELLVAVGVRDLDGYRRFELPGEIGTMIEEDGFEQRVTEAIALCSITTLIETMETASEADLVWARDSQRTAFTWARLLGENLGVPRWKNPFTIALLLARNGPPRAVLLPVMLILRDRTEYGSNIEQGLREAEQQLPMLEDINEVRARLPKKYRSRFTLLGHANLDRMRPSARAAYVNALASATIEYLQAHPDRRAVVERAARTGRN